MHNSTQLYGYKSLDLPHLLRRQPLQHIFRICIRLIPIELGLLDQTHQRRRALKAKGQASSLYLFSYYTGSSVAGTAGGVAWHLAGWNGIGLFIGGLLVVALLVAVKLAKLPLLPGNVQV